jgi:hypothetical protein
LKRYPFDGVALTSTPPISISAALLFIVPPEVGEALNVI